MEHGDLTLVGERGMSLSGGQRARLGLLSQQHHLYGNLKISFILSISTLQ